MLNEYDYSSVEQYIAFVINNKNNKK